MIESSARDYGVNDQQHHLNQVKLIMAYPPGLPANGGASGHVWCPTFTTRVPPHRNSPRLAACDDPSPRTRSAVHQL